MMPSGGGGGGYSSGGGGEEPCCPLVVDPICLATILLGIGAATYFLNIVISKKLGGKRKRRGIVQDTAKLALGHFYDMFHTGMFSGRESAKQSRVGKAASK
jgi:hypothetical protein